MIFRLGHVFGWHSLYTYTIILKEPASLVFYKPNGWTKTCVKQSKLLFEIMCCHAKLVLSEYVILVGFIFDIECLCQNPSSGPKSFYLLELLLLTSDNRKVVQQTMNIHKSFSLFMILILYIYCCSAIKTI